MPRAIWSGAISFGLVNIPVKLVTAVKDRDIHLNLLSKDGSCRLRQKLYCPDTGQEYEYNQAARGYEVAPDQYVVVTDEELEQIQPQPGRNIQITEFVDLNAIDPIYFERPYYLVPDESGAKAYRLLLQAMKNTQHVAIARFVMRQKQYTAILRPVDQALILETMHYEDEVVPTAELDLAQEVDVSKKELQIAEQLVGALVAEFDPSKYRDEYRQRLDQLIQTKAEGGKVVLAATEKPHEPRIINLREALEKSLDAVGGKRKTSHKKKSA
jgi:DNA end-binding protein Ku